MKKVLSILLIASALMLLASCIIVPPEIRHTFYFNNNTSDHIYDWYLKDESGNNYALSDDYCEVPAHHISSMTVEEGYYQVWFCISSITTPRSNVDVYAHTTTFVHLDSDVTFKRMTNLYYTGYVRSAESAGNSSDETNFVLVDSNGNEYPLVYGNN